MTTTPSTRLITIGLLAALPLVFFAGFFVGRSAQRLPTPPPIPAAAPQKSSLANTGKTVKNRQKSKPVKAPPKSPKERRALFAEFTSTFRRCSSTVDNADLYRVIASLDDAQIATVVNSCVKSGRADGLVVRLLFQRWGRFDPKKALPHVKKLATHTLRADALKGLVEGWMESDPEGAEAYGRHLRESPQRDDFLGELIRNTREITPDEAVAHCNNPPAVENRLLFVESIFERLGAACGEEAFLAAGKLRNGPDRDAAIRAAVRAWAVKNPEDVFAWSQSRAITDPQLREELADSIFYQWAERDPLRAAQLLDSPSTLRTLAANGICTIADNLADQDVPGALEWASRLRREDHTLALSSIVSKWGEEDPEAARRWVVARPPGEERDALLSTVIFQWAEEDPRSAIEWVEENVGESARGTRLSSIACTWAESAPAAAIEWAERLPKNDTRDSILQAVASYFIRQDWKAATGWLEGKPEELRVKLLPQVASSLADEDPLAAIAWVSDYPEGELRDNLVDSVISSGAPYAMEAYGEWVDSMPRGKNRDMAAQSYSQSILYQNSPLAFKMAATIDDETLRQDTYQSLFSTWLTTDPAAAKSWAERADLPEQVKQLFIELDDSTPKG